MKANTFIGNIGEIQPEYTALHPRKSCFSRLPCAGGTELPILIECAVQTTGNKYRQYNI
jgi:hypothetical protein